MEFLFIVLCLYLYPKVAILDCYHIYQNSSNTLGSFGVAIYIQFVVKINATYSSAIHQFVRW